jgi:antitoxin (DNA-binding transcriptional repressor) of toxin-antitoxin stability system
MHTATMEEVQSHLPELLDKLTPGDEVVITRGGKPVARLTPEARTTDSGQRMAAALERVAIGSGCGLPADPQAWQIEVRQDRELPGRGE